MLYVLYGPNLEEGRKKLHVLLSGLQKKRPEASLFRFTSENLRESELRDLCGARGLFEPKHIVLLDLPSATADGKRILLDALPALSDSENLFVLFEGTLEAKVLAALKKYAEKIQTHSTGAREKRAEAFNRFALPEALGRRDRKMLWVLYQKALRSGMAEEEIHGLLFWQVKSMLAAAQAGSAEASGLKPFVYSKAKSAARNYSPEELEALSARLVMLYHEARRGKYDLETALERFVLSV